MRYFSPCQVRQVKQQQQWRRQQRRRPWCSWIFLSKMPQQFVLLKNKMQRPGIEPGPPAWQARILPLNQRCLTLNIEDFRWKSVDMLFLRMFHLADSAFTNKMADQKFWNKLYGSHPESPSYVRPCTIKASWNPLSKFLLCLRDWKAENVSVLV